MKNLFKHLINFYISKFYSRHNPILKLSFIYRKLSAYYYSQKYCKIFSCRNVIFKPKVNYTKGEKYFKIGEGTNIGRFAVLTAWDSYEGELFTPEIYIGENCSFGDFLHLTCINKIVIGNGVLTGRWVTISDNSHGNTDFKTLHTAPSKRKLSSKGIVEIRDNVWIGDKATILAGVKIGEGTIVAANTVVTKDVPPYSVVAGNPAKIIKQYNLQNNSNLDI